jgi:hypothetical protein
MLKHGAMDPGKVAEIAATLNALRHTAGESSWENMQREHPMIASRLEDAIDAGATATDVYRSLLKDHGADFCRWCRTVAKYLEGERS